MYFGFENNFNFSFFSYGLIISISVLVSVLKVLK